MVRTVLASLVSPLEKKTHGYGDNGCIRLQYFTLVKFVIWNFPNDNSKKKKRFINILVDKNPKADSTHSVCVHSDVQWVVTPRP